MTASQVFCYNLSFLQIGMYFPKLEGFNLELNIMSKLQPLLSSTRLQSSRHKSAFVLASSNGTESGKGPTNHGRDSLPSSLLQDLFFFNHRCNYYLSDLSSIPKKRYKKCNILFWIPMALEQEHFESKRETEKESVTCLSLLPMSPVVSKIKGAYNYISNKMSTSLFSMLFIISIINNRK